MAIQEIFYSEIFSLNNGNSFIFQALEGKGTLFGFTTLLGEII